MFARVVRLGALVLVCIGTAQLSAQNLNVLSGSSNPMWIPRDSDLYLRMQFYVNGQKLLQDAQNNKPRKPTEEEQKLVDSGALSALDLQAPPRAMRQFNSALKLLLAGDAGKSARELEKALKEYPQFVSAHQLLGFAYQQTNQRELARAEFEAAAKLDPKFVDAMIAIGRMELAEDRVELANAKFERAAELQPADTSVLIMLCYSQHRTGRYREAIDSATRLHKLDHKKLAGVHYIAGASAVELQDSAAARREFELLVQEDPASPMAPQARENLATLDRNALALARAAQQQAPAGDSERLRNELAALSEPSAPACKDCAPAANPPSAAASTAPREHAPATGFTFRSSVEEVVLFFMATNRGRMITDLTPSEVTVLDAGRAPDKILQFSPQSKLPLHIGLLIDTSNSVKKRFDFEVETAAEFLRKMLINPSDVAFVAGFSTSTKVAQDFTSKYDDLAAGMKTLNPDGGTALFDAISLACWKLAAYPERERVANVLVVLTDGEDNSSHSSLKEAMRDAEDTGVTIYPISTVEHGPMTAADRILMTFAERTGGEALFPGRLASLGRSFDQLRDIIRSRYMVAYRSPAVGSADNYHAVSISARRDGQNLEIHARKGYYANVGREPVDPTATNPPKP